MRITPFRILFLSGFLVTLAPTGALANGEAHQLAGSDGVRADTHAPIGVMADHMHEAGEWMLSYRFMRMEMEGNRQGHNRISPEEIVTSESNPHDGPDTLRVVPTEMTMDMHMLGLMYGVSDDVTLMFMLPYLENRMEHITFQGGSGTDQLGTFTTRSSGFGDASVTGMFRIFTDDTHHLHWQAGLSLPTGSNTEEDTVLTPMDERVTLRLPYPMQLGSGTFDFNGGISYLATGERLGWGAQYLATLRTGRNAQGYTLGDQHAFSGWLSWRWVPPLSTSLRLEYSHRGNIRGSDPEITAPVQTADPNRQERELLQWHVGVNWAGQGALAGHRLAVEYGRPLLENVSGPQMSVDETATLGYQYSW